MRALSFAVLTIVLVSACSGNDGPVLGLREVSVDTNAFQVVPVAPLEIPPTRALPTPTPGGANRTDVAPNAG